MSGLDDLLKGLAAFDRGVTQYATSSAVADAHKQVTDLNNQQLAENDRLAASNQVAQGLSMRLAQAGADPAMIQAATERIAPSMGAQFQAQQNAALQQKSQDFQTANMNTEMSFKSGMAAREDVVKQQQAEQENKWKVAAAAKLAALEREKLSAAKDQSVKVAEKSRLKDMSGFLKDYQQALVKGTANENNALLSINTAKDALQSGQPITGELAQMTVVKAMSGAQFTDKQMDMLGGSQAFSSNMQQIAERVTTGKMTPQNKKYLNNVLDIMEQNTKGSIKNKAELLAKQAHARAAKSGIDIQSVDEARQLIYPEDELQAHAERDQAANGIAKNPNKGQAAAEPPATTKLPSGVPPEAQKMADEITAKFGGKVDVSPDGKRVRTTSSTGDVQEMSMDDFLGR